MLYRGERNARLADRKSSLDLLLRNLRRLGPRAVYGGLLWYARDRGWRDGWAAHALKEIFGFMPRARDRCEPTCLGSEIEEWVVHRKPKAKPRRLRKAAPQLSMFEEP